MAEKRCGRGDKDREEGPGSTMRTCGKILTIAGGGGVVQGILAGDLHYGLYPKHFHF